MKYVIYLTGILLLFLKASSQKTGPGQLNGKVISAATRQALPDVTVTLKHSGRQTVTSISGNFTLLIFQPDTLIIHHVGHVEQRVAVSRGNLTPMIISLEENTHELDEVVVNTGYQNLPKERATGSFTQIDNKLYNEQVSTNVLSRLEYITNSLTVNRRISPGGQIMIRGLSTINGVKDPLIILDNFPYEGDINNINPNDVSDITVLKDAAAASIWGAKAGNGVIVITTKKGKLNQGIKIEMNSNITVIDKPDLFYLKNMRTSDYIDVEQMLFSNQYRFSDTANPSHPPFSEVYELLFAQRNGQLTEEQTKSQIDALRGRDLRNDYNQYVYKKAFNQQYSINAGGGSTNYSWLTSFGYDKNISNLDDKYNRMSLRFQNTFNPIQRLQVTAGILYTQNNSTAGRSGYGSISSTTGIPPYTALADDKGTALPVYNNYRKLFLDTLGGGRLLDWKYYPLEEYKHINNTTSIADITANVGLNFKVTSHINLDVKYQYEKQQTNGRALYDQQSYFTRNLINTYTQLDRSSGLIKYVIPLGGILDLSHNQLESHAVRAQISYHNSWSRHDVSLIGGNEIRQTHTTEYSYRAYGYNDNILTYSNVDYANTYPQFIAGSYDFIPANNDFGDLLNRIVSLYATGADTYCQKYTISLSARRDASNLFGVNTNHKWTPLWSAGGSWDLSKESFYHLLWLPYLKIRATYGYSGNFDPSLSGVTTLSYSGNSPYTNTPSAVVRNFYNPDLQWEKVNLFNLGIDFRFINDRLTGSIEYYHKKATDLYGSVPIDYTAGLSVGTITRNVADMVGKGMDIELNSLNINRKIKWTTTLIVNLNKDKITQYYSDTSNGSYAVSNNGGVNGYMGKPVYAVFSYKWAGLDPVNGDPRGYLNGQVSKDYTQLTGSGTKMSDLVYNGPALPVISGSLGNTVSWSHLSLSARVTYKLGYYFLKQSINYSNLFTNGNGQHADYAKRWQKTGDEKYTNVPSMIYPANNSRDNFYQNAEVLVDKGDNIRLQYITLSYTIDQNQLKNPSGKHVQIYLNINDIGIIWRANKEGIDPDYRNGIVPPSKSFAIGIRATL